MAEDYRLHQALAALQSGLRQMAEEDGEISLDVAADLPNEAAALEAAMRGVVREIQDAAALADATKAQAENLVTRTVRFDAREKRLRGVLMAAMDAMGWAKREWPEATVSLKAGAPAVHITDEAALPPQFVAVKETRSPMRKEIAAALKAGEEVPGAALSNSMPVLAIKGT
jgi:Gp157 protein